MSMFNLHIVSRLIEEGNLPTAISLLNEIVKKVPAYVTPYVMLAKAYEQVDNKQGALTAWRSAEGLVPYSVEIGRGIRRNQPYSLAAAEGPTMEWNDDSQTLDTVADLLDYKVNLQEESRKEPIDLSSAATVSIPLVDESPLDELVEDFFQEMNGPSTRDLKPETSLEDHVEDASDILEEEELEEFDLPAAQVSSAHSNDLDKLIADLSEESSRSRGIPIQSKDKSDKDSKKKGDPSEVESPEIEVKPKKEVSEIVDSQPPETQVSEQLESDSVEDFDLSTAITRLETARIPPPSDLQDLAKEQTASTHSSPLRDEVDKARSLDQKDLLAQDEVVSETLARIYISQQKYLEASRVYKILAEQHPERSSAFLEKAKELRVMAAELED